MYLKKSLCVLGMVGAGIVAMPSAAAIATFQQGVDGYTGTSDTQVSAGVKKGNNYGAQNVLWVAGTNGSDPGPNHQSMIKFDDIFGAAPGQVAAGGTITSATISLYHYVSFITNGTNAVDLHQILIDIPDYGTGDDAAATAGQASWYSREAGGASDWGTLGDSDDEGPVTGEDFASTAAGTVGASHLTAGGFLNVDVTALVQSWYDGSEDNFGVSIRPGVDGTSEGFYSSEWSDASLRPVLTINYEVPEPASLMLVGAAFLAMIPRRRSRK